MLKIKKNYEKNLKPAISILTDLTIKETHGTILIFANNNNAK